MQPDSRATSRPSWPPLFLPALLLLLGVCFHGALLFNIPPGLTHDEAGHGHDAAHVLEGVTPIYFPVGYGREPLFDYLNAGLMAAIGPGFVTLRLSAFFWGVLTLAVNYAVARRFFDRPTALFALALMAVSFWPLATGRQALRSGMLPVFIGLAILAFTWKPRTDRRLWLGALGLGLMVAASLYTYIPARFLWLIFPITLLFARPPRRVWLATTAGLLLAGLLAFPLFDYLRRYPATEARLDMLDAPIDAFFAGDPTPILTNTLNTLGAFVVPGLGDTFLAYNLPGRPLFDPITFVFLLAGVGLLLIRFWRPTHALLLTWLGLGLAASLVTGPAALFTRAIAAQPLLYLLPALGFTRLRHAAPQPARPWLTRVAIAGLALIATHTAWDYFAVWGQSPDVRAAYQHTLITALAAFDQPPGLVSTVYPGVAHDAYIAEMTRPDLNDQLAWVDARFALRLPATDELTLLTTTAAPPHPVFGIDRSTAPTVQLRPTDLDPAYQLVALDAAALRTQLTTGLTPPETTAVFNGAVELLGARWLGPAQPNTVVELLTVWTVHSTDAGPRVPPAGRTDLVLFTHILNPDGTIFIQQDALHAPSWQWQPGDTIAQVHQFWLGPDAEPGLYRTVTGFYDRTSGVRATLPSGGDALDLPPLEIIAAGE